MQVEHTRSALHECAAVAEEAKLYNVELRAAITCEAVSPTPTAAAVNEDFSELNSAIFIHWNVIKQ